MDKNFGLTQERFEELLTALQDGDEQLFEQVFLSHFNSCMQYLMRNYKASKADAYDVTMDTLLVFHKRMKAGKITYGNLRFLFTQMAGQHYKRWIKKEGFTHTAVEILEHELPALQIDKTDAQIFDDAWKRLGSHCKEILKAFYYDNVSLNDLAVQAEKKAAAIRKQKQRCLEKLRVLFHEINNR
ncbi:MAG: sigma-70 family RNA polymerase sigma factor [Bacteroidota bacterium]